MGAATTPHATFFGTLRRFKDRNQNLLLKDGCIKQTFHQKFELVWIVLSWIPATSFQFFFSWFGWCCGPLYFLCTAMGLWECNLNMLGVLTVHVEIWYWWDQCSHNFPCRSKHSKSGFGYTANFSPGFELDWIVLCWTIILNWSKLYYLRTLFKVIFFHGLGDVVDLRSLAVPHFGLWKDCNLKNLGMFNLLCWDVACCDQCSGNLPCS